MCESDQKVNEDGSCGVCGENQLLTSNRRGCETVGDCTESRTLKYNPESECTLDEENDFTDPKRVISCSSVKECYNPTLFKYDNNVCQEDEKCGKWRGLHQSGSRRTFHGCILIKYCGTKAHYK